MRSYYLKIGIRNIFRNKFFSAINIAGLSFGFAAFLLILIYVKYERSYDRYHSKSERIYRLRYERSSAEGESVRFASCCPPAAIRIRELYPEVDAIARVFRYRATVIFGDRKFYEERMYFAESQLFDVFDIEMISGNPATGLSDANCAFISESAARKYFGDADPLGQTITVDREMNFVVTGIYRDFPDNSHIDIGIMLSWPNLLTHYGADIETSWGDTGFYTYFILNESATPQEFEQKLKSLVESDFGEALREYKLTCDLKVQPLTDIHLKSAFMQELKTNGNADTVVLLSIVALFIIIIAWVNYINITTARALTRATEVGLSKVAGATRRQLMLQFFLETSIINTVSIILAAVIVVVLKPSFCSITGISTGYSVFSQSWFWITLSALFLSSILISGVYPSLVLTSFSTSEVLRGKFIHSRGGILTRKLLVLLQLIIAICLMTCTLMVFRQVNYLKNRDKGINISDILVVRAPRIRDASFGARLQTYREELLKNTSITKFSLGTEVPGRQILWDAGGIFRVGSDQSKNYQIIGTDYDYLDLLEAKIIAGRDFDRSFSDSSSLILNVKATKWMEFNTPEEAVGQKVNYWDEIFTVVGVVSDYCQQSPKEASEPHILRFLPHGRGVRGFFMIKYQPGTEEQVLKLAEEKYNGFFPDNPFDYFFLEDYYGQQYRDENLLGIIFAAFAILAIIITCLGITGLTSFMMLQKTREISIRRVLGSEVRQIITLFSREFMLITLFSFIAAVPLCYLWLTGWLRTFETRMNIPAALFIIPLLATLLITFLTIAAIVSRTASVDPAENLRRE